MPTDYIPPQCVREREKEAAVDLCSVSDVSNSSLSDYTCVSRYHVACTVASVSYCQCAV